MNSEKVTNSILANYVSVRNNIQQAAALANRAASEIKLVLVTKGQPLEKVRIAVEAGAYDLGENYVEEGSIKIRELWNENQITWHMIGHIQSRKAADVVHYFNYVHSIDSEKIARRLDRFAGESGKQIPALLECNTSGEGSKFGFPLWEEHQWPNFVTVAKEIISLPNLIICGLMVMAPLLENPEEARPYFRRARKLRDRLNEAISQAPFRELSMGMSSDYQIAIEEGSTMVRIGQAILGIRPTVEVE